MHLLERDAGGAGACGPVGLEALVAVHVIAVASLTARRDRVVELWGDALVASDLVGSHGLAAAPGSSPLCELPAV